MSFLEASPVRSRRGEFELVPQSDMPFAVDVDDPSVLLGYTQETIAYDEMGEETGRSSKQLQKRCVQRGRSKHHRHTSLEDCRIRLKTLGPNSKIEKLASQIVSKCSNIVSEERQPEVMTAISDLRMAVMAKSAPEAAASEGKDASDSKAAEPATSAPPRHPRAAAALDDVDPRGSRAAAGSERERGSSSRQSRSSSRGSAGSQQRRRSDSRESREAGASRTRRRARTGDQPDVIEQRELDHLASVGPMRVRYRSPALVPTATPQPTHSGAGVGPSESKSSDRGGSSPSRGGSHDPALAALHAKQRAKEEAKFQEKWTAEAAKAGKARVAAERDAHVGRLDDYLEGAYEVEPAAKMDALRRLLSLARDPGSLEELVSSNTLLGALTRTLREDYKKNNELTTILMQLFYCMSHFSQLHDTLRSLHVPDLTMRVIDLEHKRAAARTADLQRLAALADAQARGDLDAEERIRAEDRELRAAADRLGKLQRARNKAARAARAAGGKTPDDGDEGDDDEWGEGGSPTAEEEEDEHATGLHGRRLQRARNMAQAALKMKPLPEGRIDIVRERVRQRLLARRQEKLLFPALYLLLNLSEHVHTEKALCRRGIVGYLVPLLERPFPDLLMLVTVFLRKLSVFDENVNAMAELGAVPRLVKLLPLPPAQEVLARSTIRLLYNLSFDRALAAAMTEAGLVQNVAQYLGVGSMRGTVMRLLAKLSSDHGARAEIAQSPAGELVVKMALQFPQPMLPPELGCLLVNMTASPVGAQALLARRGSVGALLKRATSARDWIILKVLHNAAIWTHGSQAQIIAEIEGDASGRVLRRMRTIRARTEAQLAGIDLVSLANSKLKASTTSPDDDAGSVGAVDGEEEGGGRSAVVRLEQGVVQDLVGPGQRQLRDTVPEDAAPVWECFDYAAHGVWSPLLAPLLRLALRPPHEDVLPDALGILAHLTPLDLPEGGSWAVLLAEDGLLDVLQRVLDPGYSAGDIVLSGVMLVQAVALQRESAPVLAQSAVISHLSGLLVECASDHEMIAQIAECVRRLAYWPETLSAMVGPGASGEILRRLAEFALHARQSVGTAVDSALAACIGGLRGPPANTMQGSAELADALASKRFMRFNREWIAAVVSEPSGHGSPSVPAEWLALSSQGGYGMGVPQSLEHSGMSELSASDAWRGQALHGYPVSGARTFSGPGDEESQEGRLGYRLGEAVGLDIGSIGAGGMEPASHARDLNGTGTTAPGRWEADDSPDDEGGDSEAEWEGGAGGYWDTMSTLRGAQMQGQWGSAGEDGDPSDVYTDAAGGMHK